jgi:hypothetical protein
MPETIYYRRKLPHIHPQNNPLFITFSLVDSLPAAVVDELKAQREQELRAAKTAARTLQHPEKIFRAFRRMARPLRTRTRLAQAGKHRPNCGG